MRAMSALCRWCVLGAMAWCAASVNAQDDLARWIPPTSNTVAVVRAKDLLVSPIGLRERWSQQQREKFAAGEAPAPPGVELVIRATEFRLTGESTPTYTVYRTLQESATKTIAQRDSVALETVQSHTAVRSRGLYFVDLAPRLMGTLEPADRQLLSRWLRTSEGDAVGAAHPFLKQALTVPGDKAQVVIALDLADMFDAATLSRWLKSAPAGEQFNRVEALAAQFATIQGARLSVLVQDDITARLQLTFGQPVGNLGPDLARMVAAWADETGSHIDSTTTPVLSVEGNTLTLEKPLDIDGLRRVMSLIQSPHIPSGGDVASAPARSTMPDVGESSRYFQAVNKLVDSLNRQNRNANDYLKTATWHENFARQILSIPTDGVDPELVAWAQQTAEALQGLAASLRGVPIQVNDLQKSIHYNVSSRNYRYASTPYTDLYRNAWTEVNTNLVEIRARQADVIAQNAAERDHVWRMIQQERLSISRRMHDKYGGAFKTK